MIKNLQLVFFTILYSIQNTLLANPSKIKPSPQQDPMYNMPLPISEDELEKIMQSIYEEYQKLPQEEKIAIAEEFKIPLDELEKNMNEVGDFLNQASQSKNNKGIFDKPSQNNSPTQTHQNTKEKETVQKNILEEEQILIKTIQKSVEIIKIFIFKTEDPYIKDIIFRSHLTKIILDLEIYVYYTSIILEKCKRNFFPELKNIEKFADTINSLEENIKNIIPLEEHINNKMKTSLYSKYSIEKNSQEKLINVIETILTEEQNTLKSLQSELNTTHEKNTKSQIARTENKISILEEDLIEAQTNNKVNNITKEIENSIELATKAMEFICNKIKLFINQEDNIISSLANIIKKYAPEEIKTGKQKEQEYKAKLKQEQSIYEQKGSQGSPVNPERRNASLPAISEKTEENDYKYKSLENNNNNNNSLENPPDKLKEKNANDKNASGSRKSSGIDSHFNGKDKDTNFDKDDSKNFNSSRQNNKNNNNKDNRNSKKKEKLNKSKMNDQSQNIVALDQALQLLEDTLKLAKTNKKDIEVYKEKINTKISDLHQLVKNIDFATIANITAEPGYQPLLFEKKSAFMNYQKTLNTETSEYTIAQKIFYQFFLIRETLLNFNSQDKESLIIQDTLKQLNTIIGSFIQSGINYYKENKKDSIPFWLKEWDNKYSPEEILNQNIFSQQYPFETQETKSEQQLKPEPQKLITEKK